MALFKKKKASSAEEAHSEPMEDDYVNNNDEDYIDDSSEATDETPPKRSLYPREYPDPCDVYLNQTTNEEEYYFNIEKTLRAHHLGFIWSILPKNFRENVEDWVWDQDWLHDISIKQHDKSERLNSYTASQQLAYDIKVIMIKGIILMGVIGGIVFYNVTVVTPNKIFDQAYELMTQKNYVQAVEMFEQLDGKKNGNLYIGFCKGMDALSNKRYDEARKIFEQLAPYAETINIDNIEDYQKEVDYQQAINYYNDGEWQKAIDIFVPVIKYKNAVEYYEKCQYNLANLDYEGMDYYNALDKFAKISTYKDTKNRMDGILSNIYSQGMEKYNKNDYMGAAEIFNSIVGYGYQDADQMSTQCFYKSAMDLFKEGEFKEACDLFSQIVHYKDSQTMVKECQYQMLNSDLYQSNILNMLALRDYRDIASKLDESPNNIYGEWRVTEIDNKAANNEVFIFDPDGNFNCSEIRLPDVAVSTDEMKYSYKWKDGYFETDDSRYQIFIDGYNSVDYTSGVYKYITLRCVKGESESIYKCQKLNDLDKYYDAEIVVNAVDTSDYELIQLYLDKLKEQEVNAPDLPSEDEESEPSAPEKVENIENLYKTVEGTVLKVYDDAFLFEPTEDSEEYQLSSRFVVLYEYATELYKGDQISLIYQDDINTEVEPFEITAHRIEYLSGNETD